MMMIIMMMMLLLFNRVISVPSLRLSASLCFLLTSPLDFFSFLLLFPTPLSYSSFLLLFLTLLPYLLLLPISADSTHQNINVPRPQLALLQSPLDAFGLFLGFEGFADLFYLEDGFAEGLLGVGAAVCELSGGER
jgi:hypothetical protein